MKNWDDARRDYLDCNLWGGLLVEARSRRMIPELRPLFVRLKQEAGFWVSEAVELRALQEVGEA